MTERNSRSKELIQGEELFTQGYLEAAKEVFLRLVNGSNPCKEALNNLGVIAYQEGNFDDAVKYFTESLAIDPSYEDALTNYTKLQEAIKKTRSCTENTGEAPPGNRTTPGHQTPDRHKAPSPQGRRARIAVLCLPGLETFLGDIVKFLQSRYEVRTCYSSDGAALESAVRWADLIWLEWANQLAGTLTSREGLLDGKRVICRVHSYEVLDGYLPRVNWAKITKTIFVAPHVLDIARRIYPRMMDVTRTVVIPNGVDLDKFSFKERAPGFTLAVVGHVNNKKNPSLWPEIMHRLVRIDDRYRIKIAGAVQEARYGLYLEHAFKKLGLEKHVQFFGHVENIAKWFESENVNYLLTTSIFESFGYAIAEAMAMGYRPLINDFPGANGLWPAECLFSSVDDLVRLIGDDGAYKTLEYRRFVEERYNLVLQFQAIAALIEEVLPEAEPTVGKVAEFSGVAPVAPVARPCAPLVSIIIPSLNYGQYIRQSINSVIEQKYEKIEIVVVEGGSTDSTIEILEEYGDTIRCIKQQSKGPVEAVNEGIRAAKGSFIGFLGADDIYMPGKIEFQVDVLMNNPSIDVVIGDCIIIDANGQEVNVWRYGQLPNRQELIRRTLLHNSFINGLSVLMRRECFDMVGNFDESLRSCADGDLWLRLLKHGCTFKHYPVLFVKHRRHGKNISGNDKAEQYVEQFRIKTLQNFTPEDLFGDILSDGKLSISSAYENLAQILSRNSKIQSAEVALKKSYQYKNQ